MKRTRTNALTGLSLLAGLVLAAGIVWATATETPVAGTQSFTVLSQEKRWVDDEGVTHVRGEHATIVVEGDLEGTGSYVADINLNFATGNGDAHGTATYDATMGDLEGGFEGRWSQTYTGFAVEGNYVGDGSGDFEGMKLIATFSGTLLVWEREWSGILLDPKGK